MNPALATTDEERAAVEAALANYKHPTNEDRTAGLAAIHRFLREPGFRVQVLSEVALSAIKARRKRKPKDGPGPWRPK